MKPVACKFEPEVLAAVLQFCWPERVDASLRQHVSGCVICSEVVALTGIFDQARQETHARAVLPDSVRAWWLAQLRARREAAAAAARPITATQVIAFGCTVGLLGACLGTSFSWFQVTRGWLPSIFTGLGAGAFICSAATLLVEHGALVVAITAAVLLLPAAAYFAMRRE